MAGTEHDAPHDAPVVAPDQLKPGHPRLVRAGLITTILAMLVMIPGNHDGNVENIWLVGIAALLAAILVADYLLRRNGLRD